MGQRHGQLCCFAQIFMELDRGNFPTLIAADPPFVPKNFFKIIPGNGAGGVERLNSGLEIEVDEDLTQIKQKGFYLHS